MRASKEYSRVYYKKCFAREVLRTTQTQNKLIKKYIMSNSKGFTLIELLVVIAIIGILAGILFVAINPAAQTNKANDATVKTAMAGIPTAAVLVNAQSFDGACLVPDVVKLLAKASVTGNTVNQVCVDDATGFVFEVETALGKTYCVDASGVKESTADAANFVCN